MAKFLLHNCCICFDLRVGSFIIGYLNVISSVIATAGCIILIVLGGVFSSSTDKHERNSGIFFLTAGMITLVLIAVLLALSIVLVVGLHKRKPGHVKAFLIFCYVCLAISVLMIVGTLALGMFSAGILVGRILGLLTSLYCVMVIRSYYFQMLEESATAATNTSKS